MPSEEIRDRRLHPSSILFGMLASLRGFALPGVVVAVGTAGWAGLGWQLWALPFVVPSMAFAALRYFTFHYRYEESEIVIRTGLFFRNERRIPYARIQNVDGVENVFHRLLGVVDVRVETGGGQEPEARLNVLPVADLEEMRRRVFGGARESAPAAATEGEAAETGAGRTLLRLSPRDLLLHGFIQNRGFVVLAALLGLIWESSFVNRFYDWPDDASLSGKRAVRTLLRGFFGNVPLGDLISWDRVGMVLLTVAGLLVAVRLVSMAWAVIRLYGFRLTLEGEDLRTEHGLLTRVTATVPLRRVQTVTVEQGPLQRLFRRFAVRVETAGGNGGGEDEEAAAKKQREWIAPMIHEQALASLLEQVLPGFALESVDWKSPHPRAFSRVLKKAVLLALLVTLPFVPFLEGWSLLLLACFLAWAAFDAWMTVQHLGWATTDRVVLQRSGWAWRQVKVAPYAKIQAVSLHESPFDRRAAMARVRVDTAGGNAEGRRVDIPFLSRESALDLRDLLTTEAGRTAFRW